SVRGSPPKSATPRAGNGCRRSRREPFPRAAQPGKDRRAMPGQKGNGRLAAPVSERSPSEIVHHPDADNPRTGPDAAGREAGNAGKVSTDVCGRHPAADEIHAVVRVVSYLGVIHV